MIDDYQQLSLEERQRILQNYLYSESLPPEKCRQLKERCQKLILEQRRDLLKEHDVTDDNM